MIKVVRCRDVGVDCDFEARAENEEEILKKCAEHASREHNMMEIPPEIIEKIREAIREE
jgi:predicted small metal-binding protein